ncbi:TonB-dependent receptor [Aequorivita viscosa]|uniref:Fe(3+) dicitrate transport protein n=1 Tax=Aequorivita viscosa TaxID=797419 RepID=A0A1M6J564_9FLAO|nr:TonB-dependent receptor [Aequorivita viscosa]SDX07169.1 Fe(3+) dicitrate transport protein [Aequorivita viscosa]SHJ41771.1 Fe(3+) dicitrate transport protein [Aequorivita viscosa]
MIEFKTNILRKTSQVSVETSLVFQTCEVWGHSKKTPRVFKTFVVWNHDIIPNEVFHLSRNLFLTVFFLFITIPLFAQFSVSGKVLYKANNLPIQNAEVYNLDLGKSTITDTEGSFQFDNVPAGTYEFAVFDMEYKVLKESITVSQNTIVNFELEPLGEQLSEVVIKRRKEEVFALRSLKQVEGTAIYAGKKSEVVVIDNLTSNTATNNARQIYAQVVGLNIYENNDGGLQLNIGGRGLNPNRTANFNTRQNGYDISADVLGYPESYYTPPADALSEIEVVRGAASLQYGTQFGGLINFVLKKPNPDKKFEWVSRQSLGSFNLFNSFNSFSGTAGKLGYYTYYNFKTGDDFRPNSQFDSHNAFAHLDYAFSEKTKLTFEMSYLHYLAQQPGGLTDRQFEEDPTFSNRTRNWFEVNWKLYSLRFDHSFSERTDFSLNVFALDASRKTVGFRENRVSQVDDLEKPRELISGNFNNWGAEARILTRYDFLGKENIVLFGGKYYQSNNDERQGPGTNGMDANFNFASSTYPNYERQSDFTFPNLNFAAFGENIFNLSSKFSVTPGFRFEYIKTQSEGEYKKINFDIAGNPILNEDIPDNREFERAFVLLGVGVSYKPTKQTELYGNLSQNYRSVTFNDIRITNPSLVVDPDISDEEGYTFDIGARGRFGKYVSYDVGAFFLSYKDRLGVIVREVSDIQEERFRGNIGDAITYGFESFVDWNILETFSIDRSFRLNYFANLALTNSEYTSSEETNVKGKKVEFIPAVNLKTGLGFGYKDFLGSLQYTYLSKQFTDATNSERDFESQSGIIGEIPAYGIMDLSVSYTIGHFKIESGLNNVLDTSYFTRRATGYPGPGILPSQPRTWYATLQMKF